MSIKKSESSNIETTRHSLSHIMASAVKELFPEVKFGIGPAIENGFYYDFDFSEIKVINPKPKAQNPNQIQNPNFKLTPENLSKIEEKMRKLIAQNISFEKKEITAPEAKKMFSDQPYKLELIKELREQKISIYQSKDFIDLCAGPHIENTKEINAKAFKLLKIAGAYWRGDEKNPMLTRIYGLYFATEKELTEYLKNLEEAEKRDHRKIGATLDLFSFHEQAPGMPFFHPKGSIIYNELYNFWLEAQKEFSYDMVICPSMLDVSIWKQSGHWDHYKDDMFFTQTEKGEKAYALRPMDCPGAIIIYNNSPKSYRDLPLRYAEPGLITRKEKSGQLGGLFRVQQFKQDDAHIFITPEQIESEIKQVIKLVDKIYQPFGLASQPFLSTRPDNFMGDIESWDKAETSLKKILNDIYGKNNWGLKEKDGAFYGPKIDYQLKDCLGRTWQCATIQLDFQMPQKFNCSYIDKDGQEKSPVLIHRTIMGSFERFMGILIEQYAGQFPLWLSPIQVAVLPIGKDFLKYGQEVTEQLLANNIRAQLNKDNETIGKKIRNAEMQKIPYILVIGEKEINAQTVAVRAQNKDQGAVKLTEFIKRIKMEIDSKK